MLREQDLRQESLQKFASAHATAHNHVSLERYLADRQTYKERRSAALAEWQSLASWSAIFKDPNASTRERFALD